MNNKECIHYSVAPHDLIDNLHDSQAGSGRHKCPSCAYESGYNLAVTGKWTNYENYCNVSEGLELCQINSSAPTLLLQSLPDYQGGVGRHKCTTCAFKNGFNDGIISISKKKDWSFTLSPVPKPKKRKIRSNKIHRKRIVDYLKQGKRNKILGNIGESIILDLEKKYLESKGNSKLAKQVRHVSKLDGDDMGYDILSYTIDGREKYIEVKTTRGNIYRPFFISENEINFSAENKKYYYLYRIFDLDSISNTAQYYSINGDMKKLLTLNPLVFSASILSD